MTMMMKMMKNGGCVLHRWVVLVVVLLVARQSGVEAAALSGKTCEPGSFLSGSSCKPCPAGTYNWLPHARSCTKCPRNTYTPFKGVVDESLCLVCPADSYSGVGSSSCSRCPRGMIRDPLSTASRCVACPASIGATPPAWRAACACAKTPAGCASPTASGNGCPGDLVRSPPGASYWDASTCVSPLTGCPAGLRLRAFIRRALCERADSAAVVCPAGSKFDGVDRCLSCSPGSVIQPSSYSATDRLHCVRCVNGVSAGGTATKCTTCKQFWAPNADGTACFNTIPPRYRSGPSGPGRKTFAKRTPSRKQVKGKRRTLVNKSTKLRRAAKFFGNAWTGGGHTLSLPSMDVSFPKHSFASSVLLLSLLFLSPCTISPSALMMLHTFCFSFSVFFFFFLSRCLVTFCISSNWCRLPALPISFCFWIVSAFPYILYSYTLEKQLFLFSSLTYCKISFYSSHPPSSSSSFFFNLPAFFFYVLTLCILIFALSTPHFFFTTTYWWGLRFATQSHLLFLFAVLVCVCVCVLGSFLTAIRKRRYFF